jgi:hypothetical protein
VLKPLSTDGAMNYPAGTMGAGPNGAVPNWRKTA